MKKVYLLIGISLFLANSSFAENNSESKINVIKKDFQNLSEKDKDIVNKYLEIATLYAEHQDKYPNPSYITPEYSASFVLSEEARDRKINDAERNLNNANKIVTPLILKIDKFAVDLGPVVGFHKIMDELNIKFSPREIVENLKKYFINRHDEKDKKLKKKAEELEKKNDQKLKEKNDEELKNNNEKLKSNLRVIEYLKGQYHLNSDI